MILLVDCGNTNTKFKLDNNDLVLSIKTSPLNKVEDYINMLIPEFKVDIEGAIISSVVLGTVDEIKNFIIKFYHVSPLVVNPLLKTSYTINDGIENKLGSDMIASMEGSHIYGPSYITIDLGTATTINTVVNNVYQGTVLASGVKTTLNAICEKASLIKGVSLDGDYDLIDTDTSRCLRSGILNGTAYLLDGFINNIKKRYEDINFNIFITGGLSEIIVTKLENKVTRIPGLVFLGLKRLYDLNRG